MAGRPHEVEPIPGGYPPGAEPFLAAIVADRTDDTARLVFADWLQENGDEDRAEFIRIQCELHRLHPEYGYRPEYKENPVHATLGPGFRERFEREQALLRLHASAWLKGFPRGMFTAATPNFVRGFPSFANTSPEQWHEHGERIRRWVPLEAVWVEGGAKRYAGLMTTPTLFGLTELGLNRASDDELRALATSPALDSLETLRIVGRQFGGTIEVPVLRSLFGSPKLTNLRVLDVSLDRAGDTLGFVIGGSPHLRNLRVLDVSDAMRDEAARELFDSPNMANVTRLDLTGNPIGDVAIRGLVRSKYLTRLTSLVLQETRLTAESGRLLATWPGLRELTTLNIVGNDLGLDGLTALSRSPYLGQLDTLLVMGNVRREQQAAVRALPGFAHIRSLYLNDR